MKKIIPIAILTFSLILSGCTDSNINENNNQPEDPVDENTENLTTYTSSEFELTHPANWQSEVEQNGVRTTVSFQDNDQLVFSVAVLPNQGGITLEDWSTEIINQSRYERTDTVSISGLTAYKLMLPESEAGPRYLFVTPFSSGRAGSKMFDISTMGLDQSSIDEVLSTFTVTD